MLRHHLVEFYRVKRSIKLATFCNSSVARNLASNQAETREIPIKFQPSGSTETDRKSQSFQSQDPTFRHPKVPGGDDGDSSPICLYEYHIPTNYIQKTILTVGAATAALLDPRRADMVAVLGETTGYSALTRLFDEMVKDPEGQEVLQDKPRINSSIINLDELAQLPDGTLGRAYIKFLNDNQVTPDSRLPVQYVDDADFAYVMQRYREAHDLFHTVLGMPTNMLGEVTVKWIEGIQTGLPMCIGGAIFGPLRFKPKQRQKYLSTYLPWAIRVGKTSKLLMNVYFERRWDQSLLDLRQELGIDEPPI